MSVHDSKKYFWLKLKEDFFDDEVIDWLEEQTNGKEYVLFYLKLCLKSLRNNGILIRSVGNILVPYDADKLAEMTKTNKDTVVVALELLQHIGLIELQENGALYLTKLQAMVGSETNAAVRMRAKRNELKALPKGEQCSPSVRPMCENRSPEYRDKSIEYRVSGTKIESSNLESRDGQTDELQPLIDFYQANIELLTPFKVQDLQGMCEDFGNEWVQKAMEKVAACEQSKRNNKYLRGVLDGWKKDGVPKPWERSKKKDDAPKYNESDIVMD